MNTKRVRRDEREAASAIATPPPSSFASAGNMPPAIFAGETAPAITDLRAIWIQNNSGTAGETAVAQEWRGRMPPVMSEGRGNGESRPAPFRSGQASLGPATQDDPTRDIQVSFDSDMEGKEVVCTVILDDESKKEVSLKV